MENLLALGFINVGKFKLLNEVLDFERVNTDHNPHNIVWVITTDNEILYVGETQDDMNTVVKDLERGNKNRKTRDRIHALIKQYAIKDTVYLLVDVTGKNSKQDLITKFSPVGNLNGNTCKE
jgi:hypothetical protein